MAKSRAGGVPRTGSGMGASAVRVGELDRGDGGRADHVADRPGRGRPRPRHRSASRGWRRTEQPASRTAAGGRGRRRPGDGTGCDPAVGRVRVRVASIGGPDPSDAGGAGGRAPSRRARRRAGRAPITPPADSAPPRAWSATARERLVERRRLDPERVRAGRRVEDERPVELVAGLLEARAPGGRTRRPPSAAPPGSAPTAASGHRRPRRTGSASWRWVTAGAVGTCQARPQARSSVPSTARVRPTSGT